MPDLDTLLSTWKSVEIVRAFFRAVARRWSPEREQGKLSEWPGPAAIKDAFFEERLYIGQRVRVSGRLSQYCPVYFPIAYSPQAQFNPGPNIWLGGYNPAPTAMASRSASGDTLAFLFDVRALETPRIVSPFHPDRTQSIPFHIADPSIPVLVDTPWDHMLEQLVTLEGVLTGLDPAIAAVIESSHEEVIKLYYHTFFRADFYPRQGYVIDARRATRGKVLPLPEIAPFATSLAVEARYSTSLYQNDLESVVHDGLTKAMGTRAAAHYQPAYYTPPGYRIVQLSQGGLLVHLAPDLGVINFATIIDTLNPDRERITGAFLPAARTIVDEIRHADSDAQFHGLFASHRDFYKQTGILPAN